MANRRYELTDEEWERVKGMIEHSKMGRPPKDDRVMVNAMLWLARSGARWEDLPERYGSHKTVYSRFCKWRNDGTLLKIFEVLNEDADMENLSLDSTVVHAHPQSAGAKKGLKTTKTINLLAQVVEGNPQKFMPLWTALGTPFTFS